MKLPIIAGDKYGHFSYGVVIATFAVAVAHLFGLPVLIAVIVLPAAIGILKEIYDANGHGTKDIMDAVATALGAVPIVVALLIDNLMRIKV